MTTRVQPRLRDLTSADAARIAEIAAATGVFREEELQIAAEVFDDAAKAMAEAGKAGKPGSPGRSHLSLMTSKPPAPTVSPAPPAPPAPPAELPYYQLGADLDGVLVGWICWGATPCTEGTWDLYWLAVDPAAQGHGVGSALVEEMENRLRGKARLIAVDTSGRPDYTPTRKFYLARGYKAVAIVPDFYAPGDDQVIFTKSLA
jgi:ribosomal protein S18 acetylase RimI-like enzyme